MARRERVYTCNRGQWRDRREYIPATGANGETGGPVRFQPFGQRRLSERVTPIKVLNTHTSPDDRFLDRSQELSAYPA
eukprot:1019023-Prorocentrum_minimum.AAC.1